MNGDDPTSTKEYEVVMVDLGLLYGRGKERRADSMRVSGTIFVRKPVKSSKRVKSRISKLV